MLTEASVNVLTIHPFRQLTELSGALSELNTVANKVDPLIAILSLDNVQCYNTCIKIVP